MEGKQIITDIRDWSQTPIIVLSENSADENVITALNMGADDYVVKPFNVDVLYARINASFVNPQYRKQANRNFTMGITHGLGKA